MVAMAAGMMLSTIAVDEIGIGTVAALVLAVASAVDHDDHQQRGTSGGTNSVTTATKRVPGAGTRSPDRRGPTHPRPQERSPACLPRSARRHSTAATALARR